MIIKIVSTGEILKTILDLGCGNKKRVGSIGVDINPDTDADIVHDLNQFPYPFDSSMFDEIYADNVIEHLDNVLKVMEELHRISKPGGILIIKVPYFRSRFAYIDPTHKHFFTTESFTYFDPEHIHHSLYNYSPSLFQTLKKRFDEDFPKTGVRDHVILPFKYFFNKYPEFYEQHISHLLPLDEITFYLKIIKD